MRTLGLDFNFPSVVPAPPRTAKERPLHTLRDAACELRQQHRTAIDPHCPKRAKVRQHKQDSKTVTEFDMMVHSDTTDSTVIPHNPPPPTYSGLILEPTAEIGTRNQINSIYVRID